MKKHTKFSSFSCCTQTKNKGIVYIWKGKKAHGTFFIRKYTKTPLAILTISTYLRISLDRYISQTKEEENTLKSQAYTQEKKIIVFLYGYSPSYIQTYYTQFDFHTYIFTT